MVIPTYITTVNVHQLGQHFKEISEPDHRNDYYQYASKYFYGAVIRSKISLLTADQRKMVVSVRLKGRSGQGQTVTGVKIDFIAPEDPRIEKYGIRINELQEVMIDIQSGIKNTFLIQPKPAEADVFFYDNEDGSAVISFRKIQSG